MAFLFVAFIVCALVLGSLLFRKYEQSRQVTSAPPPSQEAGTILVTLFFATPSGDGLKREVREIDACGDIVSCGESLFEELLNGPVGELEATLPPSFTLRGITVIDGLAILDLGKGSVTALEEGSSSEMSAIFSLVNTLSFNFPQIKKVKFLVEGETVETLKGHLDLREPIAPDFGLER
jgi:spore germination protein GerM